MREREREEREGEKRGGKREEEREREIISHCQGAQRLPCNNMSKHQIHV